MKLEVRMGNLCGGERRCFQGFKGSWIVDSGEDDDEDGFEFEVVGIFNIDFLFSLLFRILELNDNLGEMGMVINWEGNLLMINVQLKWVNIDDVINS